MTNIVTTAEQDFEAVVDKIVTHFKSLISFAGTQSSRIDGVANDLGTLSSKVETDVMAKLDGIEETIRDAVMQPIMDKIAAVEADLGAQIAALTGGTAQSTAAPDAGAASADPAPAPTSTVTTSGSTTITVDPAAGTTTAADASAGTTTVLDHATGDATATHDATGAAVAPDPTVVAAATQATQAAGVSTPAS